MTIIKKIRILPAFFKFRNLSRSRELANSPQAKKRARQNEKRRQMNTSARTMMRTYIKNTVKAIGSGDKAAAESAYKQAVPIIDKMARKGIIHENKAARHKSRLNKHIREMN